MIMIHGTVRREFGAMTARTGGYAAFVVRGGA